MFVYCTEVLGLSESAAYKRITAARAAMRFPVVFETVASGALHLAGLCALLPRLTDANHLELLSAARGMSKRSIEKLLAERFPQPDVPTTLRKLPEKRAGSAQSSLADTTAELPCQRDVPSAASAVGPTGAAQATGTTAAPAASARAIVQPLAPARYRVQLTVDQELYDKIGRARELLSHQIPDRDLAKVLDRALTLLISERMNAKFAARPAGVKGRGEGAAARAAGLGTSRIGFGARCSLAMGNNARSWAATVGVAARDTCSSSTTCEPGLWAACTRSTTCGSCVELTISTARGRSSGSSCVARSRTGQLAPGRAGSGSLVHVEVGDPHRGELHCAVRGLLARLRADAARAVAYAVGDAGGHAAAFAAQAEALAGIVSGRGLRGARGDRWRCGDRGRRLVRDAGARAAIADEPRPAVGPAAARGGAVDGGGADTEADRGRRPGALVGGDVGCTADRADQQRAQKKAAAHAAMIAPPPFTSADSRVDLRRTMRRFPTVCTTWILCAPLLICGCSRDPAPAQRGAAALSPTRSYQYSGRGAFSRVEQRLEPGGTQQLRSDTLISSGAGASSVRLVESANLDEAGRLVHADICRSVGGAQQVCFRLDQPSGVVRIERTGAEPFEWRVPADAPWVYQGNSREGGELVSTPLAGWIAARAARSSESETVRVLEPGRQRSFVAPVDQVAVATEQGTTVVLGGDGIDLREGFVEEVRLIDRGTTLSLLPPPPDPGS